MNNPAAIPCGFVALTSPSPFVTAAADFYINRTTKGSPVIGTFLTEDHVDADGYADRAFLLLLADFSLTDILLGITLNLTAYHMDTARQGDWVESHVLAHRQDRRLIFAETSIVDSRSKCLARMDAVLLSYDNRIWADDSTGGTP